ncbi:MAG: hypothetical protein E5W09_03555 [Mesorhizobium sp.]|nr:MAG: hypothetical protein E5W09_03555 [Mesorhizobium sp.]
MEEPVWETNKIHAARVRQTAERGRALVEDLRYTLALSRLVRASRALLKRPRTRALLLSLETESSRNGRTGAILQRYQEGDRNENLNEKQVEADAVVGEPYPVALLLVLSILSIVGGAVYAVLR